MFLARRMLFRQIKSPHRSCGGGGIRHYLPKCFSRKIAPRIPEHKALHTQISSRLNLGAHFLWRIEDTRAAPINTSDRKILYPRTNDWLHAAKMRYSLSNRLVIYAIGLCSRILHAEFTTHIMRGVCPIGASTSKYVAICSICWPIPLSRP